MESSYNYSTMHPPSNRESSLQNATADIRLKMLSHVFEKKSRAAVWRLEEPCECIREIQCTHSVIHRDIQMPTHFETFLLAGWCLSCRFPYSVSVSWGKKKQRHFRYDSNTERGPSTSLVYVAVFFSVSRSKFIFHKHLSDNIFCWHWTGLLQSKVQRPTDLQISIFFSWNLLLSLLYQSIVEPQEKTNSSFFSVAVAHQVGAIFGLGGLYVLRHRQVDELVLGLCLHHARALLSHHLDVFRDVNVTVQT